MAEDSTFESLSIEILADSSTDKVFIKLMGKQDLPDELDIINNFLSTPYNGMKLKTQSEDGASD